MPNDDDFLARLGFGKPVQAAMVEAVDLDKLRTIDETIWNELVSCRWLQLHQNALIIGPSGIGKTFVAAALSRKAVCDGYSVLYVSGTRLSQVLAGTRGRAARHELHALNSRQDLLVIDDLLPALLNDDDAGLVVAFLGDRHLHSSLLITANRPLALWHHFCSPMIASQIEHPIAGAIILELTTKPCLRRRP